MGNGARGRKEDGFLLSAKDHYHHCVPILKKLILVVWVFTLGASAQQMLSITHVTVIDTVTGKTQPDTTVMIQGNRITGIALSTTITPKTGQIVDGRGEYLIPGLWDMHTHVYFDSTAADGTDIVLPLFLASGITGIRDRQRTSGMANTTAPSHSYTMSASCRFPDPSRHSGTDSPA